MGTMKPFLACVCILTTCVVAFPLTDIENDMFELSEEGDFEDSTLPNDPAADLDVENGEFDEGLNKPEIDIDSSKEHWKDRTGRDRFPEDAADTNRGNRPHHV
eukprot:JP437642.1.p1 GENE.JP437642.1~~JP437642.1.p1  ORF type:complete len:103 (+),score=18.96 JP437642.1:1-309(+)